MDTANNGAPNTMSWMRRPHRRSRSRPPERDRHTWSYTPVGSGWGTRKLFEGQPSIEDLAKTEGDRVTVRKQNGDLEDVKLGGLVSIVRLDDGAVGTFAVQGSSRAPAEPVEIDKRPRLRREVSADAGLPETEASVGIEGAPPDEPAGFDVDAMRRTAAALMRLPKELRAAKGNPAAVSRLKGRLEELADRVGQHERAIKALGADELGSASETADLMPTLADMREDLARAMTEADRIRESKEAARGEADSAARLADLIRRFVNMLTNLLAMLFRAVTAKGAKELNQSRKVVETMYGPLPSPAAGRADASANTNAADAGASTSTRHSEEPADDGWPERAIKAFDPDAPAGSESMTHGRAARRAMRPK